MANKEVVHVVGALTRHQFVCVACKAALNSVHVRTCMLIIIVMLVQSSQFSPPFQSMSKHILSFEHIKRIKLHLKADKSDPLWCEVSVVMM